MCISLLIPSFKVWENVTCDITHDYFEGIAHYQLAEILNHFLYEKYLFTLHQLNSRKSLFKYGYDNDNKSVDIDIKHIQNKKFKMSASQMKCFLHYLPIFIGDYILNRDDEVWQFTLIFLKLGDLILAPSFNADTLCELNDLIAIHHSKYLELFPDSHLMPKHHFITHYTTIVKKLGPLKKMWTIRYEAKHKEIKQYALISCSRVNLLLSLAIKSNYVYANLLYTKKNNLNIKHELHTGKLQNLCHIYDHLSFHNSIHLFEREQFENVLSANALQIFDTTYKIENIIAVKEIDEFFFFSIKYVIQIQSVQCAICIKIEIQKYDEHLNVYFVKPSMTTECVVYSILCISNINYPPLEIIKTSSGENVIKLKPPFQ